MYEFRYYSLSDEQRNAYLQRIGFSWDGGVGLKTLDGLIESHQCQVPFENLDLYPVYHPILLDAESLWDKIVRRRRGGYCFELNGLFMLLLRSLGFDACSCMGRVAANREVLGALSHRVTLVRLEGKQYLVDVGFGGPQAPCALPLDGKKRVCGPETYWLEPIEEGWYLQKYRNGRGEIGNGVIFSPQAFLEQDFEPLCQALNNRTDSVFRMHRGVNLKTADGYRKLENLTLTIQDAKEKQVRELTEEEIPEVLKTYFGIEL